MAKPFDRLRAQMSPAAQALSDRQAQAALRAMPDPTPSQIPLFPALFPALPGTQGERHFRRIRQGMCPWCEARMTPIQVGRDVHAHPCNHCLYEGSLEAARKAGFHA